MDGSLFKIKVLILLLIFFPFAYGLRTFVKNA
jgi:hypothetical protein